MVKELSWTSRFILDLPAIDDQHQELIGHLNRLVYTLSKDVDLKAYRDIMGFLKRYAQFHFDDEEKLMHTVGYPEELAHKALHTEFILTVSELEKEPITPVTMAHINTFVVDWLDKHIDIEDRKIADFIHNQ